jgi:bacterial/archaeal transporter family protein
MSWFYYALLSAFFAALTAIFAKIGLKDINSNLAVAIRTTVILLFAWGIVFFQKNLKHTGSISHTTLIFLVLSGLATGLSWLFYYHALQIGKASQVAPIDSLSLVITVVLAATVLSENVSLISILGVILMLVGAVFIRLGS